MYIKALIISVIISWVLTWVMIRVALKLQVIDYPKDERRVHKKPIPMLGGTAIGCSFFVVIFLNLKDILSQSVTFSFLLAMLAGVVILLVGGYFDDKYNLQPSRSVIAPILAAFIVISSGLQIDYITNPFGGDLPLGILGAMVSWLWLLGMMYTTKFLDGLDGLVSGITVIGAVILFFASWQKYFVQPEVALLAVILTGAVLGFLVWNFNPAKIFLGEGGSLLCGFLLACLAILAKGKIATALLIMGIPILDLVWVILRRWREGKSIKMADRQHLHHRLIDAGMSQRQAVLVYYFLTASFGVTALFLQSRGKLAALIILVIVMGLIAGYLAPNRKKDRL